MKQKITFDTRFFIMSRLVAFFAASVLSAFLNLMLFQALDPSQPYILGAFSLILEISKIIAILSFNVTGELANQTKAKITKVWNKVFLFIYLIYACLSITASLGFSTMITARTEESTLLQISRYEKNIADLEKYVEQKDNFLMMSKSEFLADARARATSLEDEANSLWAIYNTANAQFRVANQRLNSANAEDPEYQALQLQRTETQAQTNAAYNTWDTTNKSKLRAQNAIEDTEAEYLIYKTEQEEKLGDITRNIESIYEQASLEHPTVALVEDYFTTQISRLKTDKGMSWIFEVWGGYLPFSPTQIKFAILILISLLLEITIFQTAVDIRISRRLLFYFRSFLPHETNWEEIAAYYDAEYVKFTDSEDRIDQIHNRELKTIIPEKKSEPEEVDSEVEETAENTENTQHEDVVIPKEEIIPDKVEEPEPIQEKIEVKSKSSNLNVVRRREVPETVTEESAVSKDIEEHFSGKPNENENLIDYNFGKTTAVVADKLKEFVSEMIGYKGVFKRHPDDAAKKIGISNRAKEVFLTKLSSCRFNGKLLIQRNKYNEWMSNFDAKDIIDYATAVKSK